MSNASQVLSRLSITAAGFVVYETGGIFFSATADGIYAAHVSAIEVGYHPYYLVTTCRKVAPRPLAPLSKRIARNISPTVAELADWVDWCDDVMEDALADAGFESDGDSRDEYDVDAALVTAAMAHTWEVPTSAADSVAIVNAA